MKRENPAKILIEDIQQNGISQEVISRNKENAQYIRLLVHTEAGFVQANECVLRFDREIMFGPPCFYTTKYPYPTQEQREFLKEAAFIEITIY